MNLQMIGCDYRSADICVRERLTLPVDRLASALAMCQSRFGGEAAIISTCNRLEFYLADGSADLDAVIGLLTELTPSTPELLRPVFRKLTDAQAVRHLFRVASSLESLMVGEGQIAGQVKTAYEAAVQQLSAGPLLHAVFQHSRVVARRVKRETGLGQGQLSIASLAVEFVRQVFDQFADKTVLVIGAGKMGVLTLNQLKNLGARRILVANRSHDKAVELAAACGGRSVAWDQLDDAMATAHIVLSTTGAPEPIMTALRFHGIANRRTLGPMVVLDIAVPRDFDPAIHDGESAFVFNIDDLTRIRDATLAERLRHVPAASAIVDHETQQFVADWARRKTGPVIAKLTAELDAKRQAVLGQLMNRLNGRLTPADKQAIEAAFRLLQNQFLHAPVRTIGEEARAGKGTLLSALRDLFGLK